MKRFIMIGFALILTVSMMGCGDKQELTDGKIAQFGSESAEATNSVSSAEAEAKWDMTPAVMVDGVLYFTTGMESTVTARCGVMDGEITSSVPGTELPTKDDQSNFGTGYGYQYGADGTVEINVEGAWWVYATETSDAAKGILSDINPWGIVLSAENITPTGLTLIVSQEGGTPTGELQFGSDYTLKVRQNDTWQDVPYIFDEGNVAWTQEAYLLPLGGSTSQEITWEYLYGELPVGRYLLSKTFQDFRGIGDFDTDIYAVEFEVP